MRLSSLCAAALAALTLAASTVSCEKGPPRYTLRQVMVEIDYADKALMKNLADPAQALPYAKRIERWFGDPALDRHVASKVPAGDKALFDEMRTDFASHIGPIVEAAGSGDTGALRASYMRLRMRCDVCHNKFRPGLVLNR